MLRVRVGTTGNGAAAFDRVLGVAADIVGDMKPIFDRVVRPYVLEHLDQQFNTLGAHGGKPWASLDGEPKYRAFKRAILGEQLAAKVLWWDSKGERLRPSLVNPQHPEQVWQSSSTRAFFSSRVPYAADLIRGGRGPFGERYPGREIFAMTQGQRKELVTLMQREIVQQVEGRGFSRMQMRDSL
jgi:hypothetical protein